MSSSTKTNKLSEAKAAEVYFTEKCLCLRLTDEREIRVPLSFYPKLKDASRKDLENNQIIGLGSGIHWPELDEDLSVEGILLGNKHL